MRIIYLITHIDRFQRNSVRVLILEIIGEIAIQDITQDTLSLLAVVGIKRVPLDLKSVLEEKDRNILMLLESFHVALDSGYILFLSYEVQLFDSSGQHFCIDFFWKIITVLGSLEFQLFVYSFLIELALMLAIISTYPFQPVVTKKFEHLVALLFVFVPILLDLLELTHAFR